MRNTYEKIDAGAVFIPKMTSLKDNPTWLPVFITEFLIISTINVLTLLAFARIRHLRKRSTYLIINLAVTDLLVGCLSGPAFLFSGVDGEFTWTGFITFAALVTFPLASQINLSVICLDRLHATVFPFRHCLLGRWVYCRIITGSWFITLAMGFLVAFLYISSSYAAEFSYLLASFTLLTLLVLTVSYSIVRVNVQRRPDSQNIGSIATERKLTVTLFIVTGVSVLTMLPVTLYKYLPINIQKKVANPSNIYINIGYAIDVIYFASSIVNPLVYAIRLQEFRKAIRELLAKQDGAGVMHPFQMHSTQKIDVAQME